MYYYQHKGHGARWHCNGRLSMVEPVCGASMPADKLETAVLLRLIDLATDPKRVRADFIQQQAAMTVRQARARDMIAAAEAMVQQHQDALARLDADHALGRISDERHARVTALVMDELQRAQADLETCRADIMDIMADDGWHSLETYEGWQKLIMLKAEHCGVEEAEKLVEGALRLSLGGIITAGPAGPVA
jgi:hypothetical protein